MIAITTRSSIMVKIPVFTPRGKNLGQGTRKGKAVKGMIAAFRTSDNMSVFFVL